MAKSASGKDRYGDQRLSHAPGDQIRGKRQLGSVEVIIVQHPSPYFRIVKNEPVEFQAIGFDRAIDQCLGSVIAGAGESYLPFHPSLRSSPAEKDGFVFGFLQIA